MKRLAIVSALLAAGVCAWTAKSVRDWAARTVGASDA